MSNGYYHHGAPGRYGLVDAYQKTVWAVDSTAHRLLILRRAFYSKLTLLVVDLSGYSNYREGMLDNSCCLNWRAPINVDKRPLSMVSSPVFTKTFESVEGDMVESQDFGPVLTMQQVHGLKEEIILCLALILAREDGRLTEDELSSLLDIASRTISYYDTLDDMESFAKSELTSNRSVNMLNVLQIIGRLYD